MAAIGADVLGRLHPCLGHDERLLSVTWRARDSLGAGAGSGRRSAASDLPRLPAASTCDLAASRIRVQGPGQTLGREGPLSAASGSVRRHRHQVRIVVGQASPATNRLNTTRLVHCPGKWHRDVIDRAMTRRGTAQGSGRYRKAKRVGRAENPSSTVKTAHVLRTFQSLIPVPAPNCRPLQRRLQIIERVDQLLVQGGASPRRATTAPRQH